MVLNKPFSILPTRLFAIAWIFSVTRLISFLIFVKIAGTLSLLSKLPTSVDILPTRVLFTVFPSWILSPIALKYEISPPPSDFACCGDTFLGDFPDFAFCSLVWSGFSVPFGFLTLLVYPVNGWNGPALSEIGTWEVLPKHPIITGVCALSVSKKNPKTTSPGDTFTLVTLFDAPVPEVVGSKHCAQGKSSSGSSVSKGWYPMMRTLNLFPHPAPLICPPWAFSGGICPIHQRNPSLPKKLVFSNDSCIIYRWSHLLRKYL